MPALLPWEPGPGSEGKAGGERAASSVSGRGQQPQLNFAADSPPPPGLWSAVPLALLPTGPGAGALRPSATEPFPAAASAGEAARRPLLPKRYGSPREASSHRAEPPTDGRRDRRGRVSAPGGQRISGGGAERALLVPPPPRSPLTMAERRWVRRAQGAAAARAPPRRVRRSSRAMQGAGLEPPLAGPWSRAERAAPHGAPPAALPARPLCPYKAARPAPPRPSTATALPGGARFVEDEMEVAIATASWQPLAALCSFLPSSALLPPSRTLAETPPAKRREGRCASAAQPQSDGHASLGGRLCHSCTSGRGQRRPPDA
ncbi:uncharacterized protein DKFZp434B061-like [Ahaetulla prasina]|uniref:uncharacterized protein DKFZp434B061-like n=1 Tax=Ahaetulla prasina TaxID=499056 RepID=UPI002649D725|nr:uncharacterized protein DKFZp434B061-like [Ahaetulla prasina]